MLIEPGVGLVGTVGGGCGEAEVIQAALEVIRDGVARVVEVDLTRDLTSLSPAVCGGIMRIFVEPVRPLSGASDG
jgi:xanthine dehydrogenase accessory factor